MITTCVSQVKGIHSYYWSGVAKEQEQKTGLVINCYININGTLLRIIKIEEQILQWSGIDSTREEAQDQEMRLFSNQIADINLVLLDQLRFA